MNIMSIVSLFIWLPGYFFTIENSAPEPVGLLSAFGWRGFPLYIAPFLLTLILLHFKARKSALLLSIIILLTVLALRAFSIVIGSYDTKTGEYWILRHIDQIYAEIGWLFMILGSLLMVISTKRSQSDSSNISSNSNIQG